MPEAVFLQLRAFFMFAEHASQPRNRNIANVFYKAGFIENWGRGINKMREGLNKAGLKDPVIENSCGGTLLTIYRNVNDAAETNDTANDTVNDTVNNCLTERQLVIIKSMPKKKITCS